MGYFSYVCAVCDQEVMHGNPRGYKKFTNAVVLWPNGDRMRGEYDGYGRIGSLENLQDQHGGWRIVHECCFNPKQGQVEMWASFFPLRHAEDQGCHPSERVLVQRYGEPDHSELTRERNYFCYECKRTWKAKWSGGLCPFGCVRPKNYRDSEEQLRRAADPEDWVTGDHNELVESFEWIGGNYDQANGLIRCHNEYYARPDWSKRRGKDADPEAVVVEPCWRFGELAQARVTKPDDWDEMTSYFAEDKQPKPFVVICRSCKSDNVEVIELTPGEPS